VALFHLLLGFLLVKRRRRWDSDTRITPETSTLVVYLIVDYPIFLQVTAPKILHMKFTIPHSLTFLAHSLSASCLTAFSNSSRDSIRGISYRTVCRLFGRCPSGETHLGSKRSVFVVVWLIPHTNLAHRGPFLGPPLVMTLWFLSPATYDYTYLMAPLFPKLNASPLGSRPRITLQHTITFRRNLESRDGER
jgi:hypothetical protein